MHQGIGSGGAGGWSFESPAVDCGPASAPVPDAGGGMVTAAPGNLRSTITGTTVRLDWNPLPEVVTSFLIEAGSAPALANLAQFNTGNPAPSLVVNNVPSGVYFVRVRAIGPDGIPGPPSNEVIVRVGVTCDAPPGPPTAVGGQVAGNQVTLVWAAPTGDPPSSYIVEAGSSPGTSNVVVFDTGTPAPGLSATAPNGLYYVRIRGRNGCGVGTASNEVIVDVPNGVRTPQLPPPPLPPSPPPSPPPPEGGGGGGGGGGTPSCSYSASPRDVPLTSLEGTFAINVTTAAGCQWSASADPGSFISLRSSGSTSGPGTATFGVGSNSGSQRFGVAHVTWPGGGQDVPVSQLGPPPPQPTGPPVQEQVSLPPTQPGVMNQMTVMEPVPPVANAGACTNCPTTAPPTATPASPGTVNLGLTSGNQEAFNAALIGLLYGTATTQSTSQPSQSASIGTPSSTHFRVTFDSLRTSATIAVNVLVGQPVTFQVAVVRDTQQPTNYESITPAPTCPLTLTGPAGTLPSSAGSFNVGVSIPAGCTWNASSLSPFITVTTASGTGPTAIFAITANTTTTQRSGVVRINGQDVTITQAGLPNCPVTATPATVPLPQSGGQQLQVAVTIPAGCQWTAASLDPFITVASGATGTGNGTVTYNVTAASTSRSGTIRIASASASFDVRVAQAMCLYSAPTSPLSFGGGATTFTVPLTVAPPATPTGFTAADCLPWSASSPSPFITVPNPGPFSGSGQASFNLAANNSGASRSGSVRLSSGSLNFDSPVSQLPCSFTLSPLSFSNVSALGTTIDVNVTTGSGCTWTAASQSPAFITVFSGSSGTGSGVARFTVQANSGTPRTGSVRISYASGFQDVAVSQLGASLLANFTVNPNPCPVVSGPSAFVVATCTFDGSSSTGVITSYLWNIAGVTTSGVTVTNVQFPCGTFASGLQVRDVTLTVSGPAGSNQRVMSVTFRKDSGC